MGRIGEQLRERLREGRERLRERRFERLFGIRRGGPPRPRGFVVLQIDSLATWVLEEAMRRRRARFLRSLLRRGGFRLHRFRCGLPATTPAFQAGVFYGDRGQIPGFRWFERKTGETIWLAYPWDCARVEQDFRGRWGLLAEGGSSYFNMFTGGADNRLFDSAAVTFEKGRRRRSFTNLAFLTVFFVLAAARGIARSVVELALEAFDVARGLVARRRKKDWGQFLLRALSNAFVNELAVVGVREEVRRGTRFLYLNFIGYDKAAHARGATHSYALWTMRQIDRDVRRVWRALHRSDRKYDYDLFVLSDHGIVDTVPIDDLEGENFETILHAGRRASEVGAAGKVEESAAEARRSLEVMNGLYRIFPPFSRWIFGPFRRRAVRRLRSTPGAEVAAAIPRVVVRPTGNLAHLYVVGSESALAIEDLEERSPALLRAIENSPYVDFYAARGRGGALLLARRGERHRLPRPPGPQPHEPLGLSPWEVEEIRRVVAMERAGDLLLFAGRCAEGAYNFQHEYASHGGLLPEEQDCFLLAPPGVVVPEEALSAEGLHAFFASRYRGRTAETPVEALPAAAG